MGRNLLETCQLDSLLLRLAPGVPVNERYQDRLAPVDPSLQFLPNRRDGLVATPGATFWAVREWDSGEGYDRWDPEVSGFEAGLNVVRKRRGQGLVLGARQTVTVDNGGSSTFNDGRRFGYGLGGVWTGEANNAYKWDVTNSKWGAAVATGAAGSLLTSFADGDDGVNMFTGHENKSIRKWSSGGNSQHVNTAVFTHIPVLRSFAGRLWALDGDDLYEVDMATPDTRTLKVDATGVSTAFLASTPWAYGRMSMSDKGPIWLQRLDSGQTLIWEYNVATDTGSRIGRLPLDFAFPYSIFHAFGFVFVAFRAAPSHAAAGEAFVYYQRGGQRGVLGPIRSLTGSTGSKPVIIAGVDGSDMVIFYDGGVFVYDLGRKGLFLMSDKSTTGSPADAITIGPTTLIGPVTSGGNTKAVERFNRLEYTTRTARIDSGLYDLTYFDVPKMLLDVTVVTDPLPANTQVQVAYSVEGDSFVTVGSTHNVDGETFFRFPISTAGSGVVGRQFGIRLIPATTDVSVTPTIRGWTAMAVSAADERTIYMKVDMSEDDDQNPITLIAGLQALKQSQRPVNFVTPFQRDGHASAETVVVTVRDVLTPDVMSPTAPAVATVVLRALELVT